MILSPGLRRGFGLWAPRHAVKIVTPDGAPATSIGGFRCQADHSFQTAPNDFAALVLVGGMNWWGDETKRVIPLVEKARKQKIALGAICDASMFLGVNGLLNDVDHTSNGLAALKEKAGAAYTGETRYKNEPSVIGDGIVTANGAGFIDFACNMVTLLKVADSQIIDSVRTMCKTGFFPGM
jgi:transcriptional regulator GlxA family with amidase domain